MYSEYLCHVYIYVYICLCIYVMFISDNNALQPQLQVNGITALRCKI